MTHQAAFRSLLETARKTHLETPALQAFCPFPDDLEECAVAPFWVPAAELMLGETNWPEGALHPLAQAFIEAGPGAHWRETYKDTDIGEDFLNRFGCYCLIGPEAPWFSQQMFGFVIYMPASFWYTWHHHPAEEVYFVLAGEGVFLRKDKPPQTLRAGEVMFHASGESHALRTDDYPIMAYVLWRNHFDVMPVLSEDVA